MKSRNLWAAAALTTLAALVGTAYLNAQGPQRKTVIGEVIDVASYAMKGARGEEHAEAGAFRAEGGFPVGILEEETGEVYIAVYRNPAPASALEPANKILAPLMGKGVVVQGRIYDASGIKVIQISIVAEM